MPVLPAEPHLFPDCLFDDVEPPEIRDRAWQVLHVFPRQEKTLARHLRQKSIPFYLPLIFHRFRLRARTMTSYLPLFPGYLFLLGTRDERLAAVSTHRVVRSLEVIDQEGLWHDLQQINRLIATGAPITPESRLGPGMPVEIRNGPLAGLRGKIIRRASGDRFVVQIDFIQKGASVLLEDFNLTSLS